MSAKLAEKIAHRTRPRTEDNKNLVRGSVTKRKAQPLAELNYKRARTILERMYQFFMDQKDANGKHVTLTREQLMAGRIIIDRSVPILKSTEFIMKDQRKEMSTRDLQVAVAQMMATNPKLVELMLERNPQMLDQYGVVPKMMEAVTQPEQKPVIEQQVTKADVTVHPSQIDGSLRTRKR